MAAVHFPPGDDGKTGRKGVVQAVLVLRADGSTDVGDFFREKRQRCFQHEPLQAVAAKVCVDDGAVGIGPVLPLGARHIHEGRIVVCAAPAEAHDEIPAKAAALPCADAQVIADIGRDVFQRVRHELLRVRHGGAHLVLQGVHRRGLLRRAAAQLHGHRRLHRLAADLVQKNFHLAFPSKIKSYFFAVSSINAAFINVNLCYNKV